MRRQVVPRAGRLYSSWLAGNLVVYPGYMGDMTEYFVDSVNGSDSNDGLSWERAKQTIDAAVDLARYLPGTTTIDDTKDHHTCVYVAPGHYNEQLLFSGYNIHLIGCPVHPGKDYGVCLNYDAAVTTTCCLGFSGSGIEIANFWVNNEGGAIPGIYCAGGDNNVVRNCIVDCGGTGTYGIHMASMKGSVVEDCIVETPATGGILVAGGADVYFIQGYIENNMIHGDATGVIGIDIQSNIVAYSARVRYNTIDVLGGGATAYGIYNRSSNNILITRNDILLTTANRAVVSSGKGILHNAVSANGTVTDPFDDD